MSIETHPAPATEFGDEADLAALYRDLAAVDLRPLWTMTEQLLTPTPRPAAVPWLWSAATMRPLARRAIALVPVERGGERRVLSLQNPGLGGRPYAVGTLWGALQCLGPREVAPAHRHSPGAIRFGLEGEGVWTTVDGEMFWFDGLDLPMVAALDRVFFGEHPGPEESQPEPAEHDVSERRHAGGTRYVAGSVTETLSPRHSRLMNHRWADGAAGLDRLAASSDDALVAVEYVDPETGASVLPTMACAVHRVRAGRRSTPVRRAGDAIHVGYQGTGSSVIAGQDFDRGPGDVFVVPSWAAVEHAADEQADLFVVSDEPVLRALGIARSETLAGPQQVTGTFTPR